jgi:hypothetical protein
MPPTDLVRIRVVDHGGGVRRHQSSNHSDQIPSVLLISASPARETAVIAFAEDLGQSAATVFAGPIIFFGSYPLTDIKYTEKSVTGQT